MSDARMQFFGNQPYISHPCSQFSATNVSSSYDGGLDIYTQSPIHPYFPGQDAQDALHLCPMGYAQHNLDKPAYLSNHIQFSESPLTSPSLSPSGISSGLVSLDSSMVLPPQDPNFEFDMTASVYLNDLSKLVSHDQNAPPYHNRSDFQKLDMYFLDPGQNDLRILLNRILASSWFQKNEKEPEHDMKRSILSPFLQRSERGNSYKCRFDFCSKSFDRQDRALGHVRMHIGHRPFQCGGRCGASDCKERFFCLSYLSSHMKRPKEACAHCGNEFHRQHLKRHSVTCTGFLNSLCGMRNDEISMDFTGIGQ